MSDISDADMALVYATENATQRGNSTTAVAGSIASAIRLLTKAILLGHEHLARILATSPKGWETAGGNLTEGRGLGHELLEQFLSGVPHLSKYLVKEQ